MIKHLSIRVPWHDDGWRGSVCKKPTYNNSCLRLKNIYENKDDKFEESIAGCSMCGNEAKLPCLGEGIAFMSKTALKKVVVHPYKISNPKTHGHFIDTEIEYPPYSLPARPYAWLMKDRIKQKAQNYNIKIDLDNEPILPFNTNWIQDARNHKEIFNYFYEDILPEKSLVIPYAKQIPFIDDSRRVVLGIGKVIQIFNAKEHNYTNEGKLRSMTWETMVCHSIRSSNEDGFLFPYKEMLEYADNHPKFDLKKVIVFADDDYFEEFSYATEHVSYDAIISILLKSIKSLTIINECLDSDWSHCIRWLNERLSEVWDERGTFPGLGEMLCSLEMPLGMIMAKEIKDSLCDNEDIWEKTNLFINNPQKYFSQDIASSISDINIKTWNKLSTERKTLFKLLSRFSFTINQANILFHSELREKNNITCTDKEIIENPYVLYEQTRNKVDELYISIRKVDMAVFPILKIRDKNPLPIPSRLKSENDQRRIRAIAISLLEESALEGNTVLPKEFLIESINELPIEPPCKINGDIMDSIEDYLKKEVIHINMKEEKKAYKLVRLNKYDEIIKKTILKRIKYKNRLDINVNWREIIDNTFNDDNSDSEEERARIEKTAVLDEISKSRISVLIGDAGTGKTALLSILCKAPEISNGGVLLLAPTGKARVRMTQSIEGSNFKFNAFTIAQFLSKSKRYNPYSMTYELSNVEQKDVPNTVIIDESSMLTEEMFGALMEALKTAKRIIFVGDPNQLPPIGAGRPFVDLVTYLKRNLTQESFPKVCNGYGELTVHRRQKGKTRLDVKLAQCFTNSNSDIDLDIFEQLQESNENIEFKRWKTNEELEELIFNILAKELKMKSIDDIHGFNKSLGAIQSKGYDYFNVGSAKKLEDWQILSPIRNMPHGVTNINRIIHNKYRQNFVNLSKQTFNKKIPKMVGPENIVYGDKVINVINDKKDSYKWNKELNEQLNYVANGEIGILCGNFGKNKANKFVNIEFSSQQGVTYSYKDKDFNDENNLIPLELAYALTVHKAQGSQFKTVILVIAEPCRLISKEMIYTALTRQTEKVIILYNEEAYKLKNYTSMMYSDIARRFTDLFEEPLIVKINERYYEDRLIHRTSKGELVRSKSEVIIANLLYYNKIDYKYEERMKLGDSYVSPDFTIIDEDTGETFIWEHCGMMENESYKNKWLKKKSMYEKYGYVEGENLIVTYDNNGVLDSQSIEKIIKEKFIDFN